MYTISILCMSIMLLCMVYGQATCNSPGVCQSGQTCCTTSSGPACCPVYDACCCPDQEHCCGDGLQCQCFGTCPGSGCSCQGCVKRGGQCTNHPFPTPQPPPPPSGPTSGPKSNGIPDAFLSYWAWGVAIAMVIMMTCI